MAKKQVVMGIDFEDVVLSRLQVNGITKFTESWNAKYPNDKRDFLNSADDRQLMIDNLEVGIKMSLLYWEMNNFNANSDKGLSDVNIQKVTKKLNGGTNHLCERKQKSKQIFNTLKKEEDEALTINDCD